MSDIESHRKPDDETAPDAAYVAELRARQAFIDRQNNGRLLIKRSDVFHELTRMGKVEWYLHPQWFHDTALQDWYIFIHDIRGTSGAHTHQGGLALFVLEGRGWTVMDGVRYDWEAGDLILLPMKPGGVEHQHTNADPSKPARFLALISQTMYDQGASEMVQGDHYHAFTSGDGSA